MVTIQGLSGVPEPKPNRAEKVKNERENASAASEGNAASGASAKDGINISPEAKQAVEVQRVLHVAKTQDEIRADHVEAAKQRIAEGEYKNREVVAKVAQHLIKLLG